MKTKLQIQSVIGTLLFEYEAEDNSIKKTLVEAVAKGAYLRGADLTGANLRGADLRGAYLTGADLTGAYLTGAYLTGADLTGAYLTGANLTGADLTGAYLRGADLTGADLTGADLQPIKDDLFVVLLHGMAEISFLKKKLIEGKIDGSTYDGECACLSGTLENAAKFNDGPQEETRISTILSCRNASRPIEAFFAGINIGDTPDKSQHAKLVMDWIGDFEKLVGKTF